MIKKYFWQILSAILFILLLITCKKPTPDTVLVVTPEKKGSFKSIKPEPIKVPEYIYTTLKGDKIVLENPVNLELACKYEQLEKDHDSIKLKLAYLEAIQIHKYNKKFQDKNLDVYVQAQTTGTLDSLRLDYTIHPDTIPVHIPKERFALLLGGDLYNSGFKANVGIQINDKHLITCGYDPINQRVFAGYNIKVFSFKK